MNSLSTFSLSKSWVEVLDMVSSLSSVSCSVAKDVSRLGPCFSGLFRLFIICPFCLFFNIPLFSLDYNAPFFEVSFSFFNYYIRIRIWIDTQYDCFSSWSNINSSSWHHSMFLFNLNDFLLCNTIYILDFSFNGMTSHFSYIRQYSWIAFFNFEPVYISKSGIFPLVLP